MNFGRGRNFVRDKSPGPVFKKSQYGTEAGSVASVITKGGHVVSPQVARQRHQDFKKQKRALGLTSLSPRRNDGKILAAGRNASRTNVQFIPQESHDPSLNRSLDQLSLEDEDVQAQLKKANQVMKSVYLKTPYKVLTFK